MCQFNDLMRTGQVPTDWQSDWRKTSFKMLPKTIRAKVPSEYRPIATIRLFHKLFAYMILGRVETQLETHQPEEQHGFRGGKRVEEHLVTTRLVLDKLSNADVPIWIVSLDLSKAFDRVHWPALWLALPEQGLSEHMIWMIQNLYRDQQGQVVGTVFRNTTWASLDQEGFNLATTGAQTQWPPKIFLGYFDYKLLPLEEFTLMGGLCN